MEDSEVFCPHCKEYIAPRTFHRHKALYCKDERTWDLDVPSNSSSDEESSTLVNYDDDREEASLNLWATKLKEERKNTWRSTLNERAKQ